MSRQTTQRQLILQEVFKNSSVTKSRAVELCTPFYYCNASKHVGDILSRMVKAGVLKRTRQGVYERGNGIPLNRKFQVSDTDQLKLF